jgi:hypothetical protein
VLRLSVTVSSCYVSCVAGVRSKLERRCGELATFFLPFEGRDTGL